jgi:hypothetical protein
MRYFIYTCILFFSQSFLSTPKSTKHPIFVTVTEIEQNIKEKSVEISCKIFTDDFEKALRAAYKLK